MFIPVSQKPSDSLRPANSGISANDWSVLADFWYPVAIARDVTDKPAKARLLDVDLVLFRGPEGTVGATIDECPHRQIRLSSGQVIDGQVVCPFHGLRFDTGGRCRLVPTVGAGKKLPAGYRVRAFPTRERYGLIWTCLGDPAKHDVPDFPDLAGVPDAQIGIGPPLVWPVSAPRQIENFFDLAHLPLVHRRTLGGDPDGFVKPGHVEQRPDAVLLTTDYIETPEGGTPRPCKFIYRIVLPFAIDFTVHGEGEHVMHAFNIPCPISAHESRVFQLIKIAAAESLEASLEIQRNMVSFFDVINQEDLDVLKELVLPDLPLDQHHEIHLPVDNICGAYRMRLRELGLGRD